MAPPQNLSLVVGFDPSVTQMIGIEPGTHARPGTLSHRIDPAGRILLQLSPADEAVRSSGPLVRLLWRAAADGAAAPTWPVEHAVATDTLGAAVPVVRP